MTGRILIFPLFVCLCASAMASDYVDSQDAPATVCGDDCRESFPVNIVADVNFIPCDCRADNCDFRLNMDEINLCPFETESQCEIWRAKPLFREIVSSHSPKIHPDLMEAFIAAAHCNANLNAGVPVSAPLLARYKILMRSAGVCCTESVLESLRQKGKTDDAIYKFIVDDINFYGATDRCLMMTDDDLISMYRKTENAKIMADARDGCLCRNRRWFSALLAPFGAAYKAVPKFADADFSYTYRDGLQREITVSINKDVQNVLTRLAQCP